MDQRYCLLCVTKNGNWECLHSQTKLCISNVHVLFVVTAALSSIEKLEYQSLASYKIIMNHKRYIRYRSTYWSEASNPNDVYKRMIQVKHDVRQEWERSLHIILLYGFRNFFHYLSLFGGNCVSSIWSWIISRMKRMKHAFSSLNVTCIPLSGVLPFSQWCR